MTRAVYTFVEKNSNQIVDLIEFDLLDNVGVKAWQYAVMLNQPDKICFKHNLFDFRNSLPKDIDQQYQKLIDTIHSLDCTDYVWRQVIPESFDQVDQDFFNRLHRHFTNSCCDVWDHRSQNFANFDINSNLQNLNTLIHTLEKYVATDIKLKYLGAGKEICLKNPGTELGYDLYPFRQYHSYEPADLILDGYILGKTLIESFVCRDNPSAWDTNGHFKTNGGATVLLDHTRTEIYNSEEFNTWLSATGGTKHNRPADFPLGNFVAGHKPKLESLQYELHKFSVKLHIQQ